MTALPRQQIDTTNIPLAGQSEMLRDAIAQRNDPPSLFVLPGDRLGVVRFTGGEWSTFPLGPSALNARFTRWVQPQKAGRGGALADMAELPFSLVNAYVEEQDWVGVPRVQRLAVAPVVRPDWTVCWDEGYDPGSEVFVTAPGLRLDEAMTEERIKGIAQWLLGHFRAFAFEHESSAADCLGLALTPLIIGALPGHAGIPGGVMTANHPGSGKTKLAEVVALMGSGLPAVPQTLPLGQQMKTHITTLLNSGGKPVVIFDNIKVSLDNDALESLLTSRTWMDRKFRTQDDVVMRNDTQWLFTLNNASASPDMMRRLIMVPLDTNKSPAVWDPKIIASLMENLAWIRSGLAILVEWWVRQGRPTGSASRAGFEDWFETVSGILETAGVTGFNAAYHETSQSVYNEDEDLADIIDRIGRIMGTTDAWRAGDLWDAANDLLASGLTTMVDRQAVQEWLKIKSDLSPRSASIQTGRKLQSVTGKRLPGASYYLEDHKPGSQSRMYTCHVMPGAVLPQARQSF